jgi:hypothetical protein
MRFYLIPCVLNIFCFHVHSFLSIFEKPWIRTFANQNFVSQVSLLPHFFIIFQFEPTFVRFCYVQLLTCANLGFMFLVPRMPPKPYIILFCIYKNFLYIYGPGINISKFLVVYTCLWSFYLIPLLNMCSLSKVMLFQVYETLEIKKHEICLEHDTSAWNMHETSYCCRKHGWNMDETWYQCLKQVEICNIEIWTWTFGKIIFLKHRFKCENISQK